jgi:carbamate kinase
MGNALPMARAIADLGSAGHRLAVVHGNGPQVGSLAIQQEEGARLVPPQPLFALGAMTQGQLGSLLELALCRAGDGPPGHVVSVVTHVVVDPADPAFASPSKPIGPYFPPERARRLAAEKGWTVQHFPPGGWRRVVPSPEPLEILESEAIRALVEAGYVVLAAGGGGVPVVREGDGEGLSGMDAVIDKDLAAERLATSLGAVALVLVTDVDQVCLGFGTPEQRAVAEMIPDEAEAYLAQGHFGPGSMGPKVSAAIRFVRHGGEVAVITSAANVAAALAGRHGTRLVAKHGDVNKLRPAGR